jgi:hypothetical protein
MVVGSLAMKFKLRSSLVDPESTDLLKQLEKEKEEQNNEAKDNKTPEHRNFYANMLPQKKKIADTDIDKKKESLIRNFYDSRKHNRSFTKIKGK